MRSRLRRFAAVGLLVTAVDVAVLVALRVGFGVPVLVADAVAIVVAGTVSFAANRALTFTRDPHLRFVDEPLAYGAIALVAGLVDLVVLRVAVTAFDSTTRARCRSPPRRSSLAVAGVVRVVGYRRLLFRQVRSAIGRLPASHPPASGDKRLSVVIPAFRAEPTIARHRRRAARARSKPRLATASSKSWSSTTARRTTRRKQHAARAPTTSSGSMRTEARGPRCAPGCSRQEGERSRSRTPTSRTSLAFCCSLLEQVEAGWDVVVGSRRHVETVTLVRARRLREVTGRVFNLISLAVLLGAYRDTQCGLKAFRSDAAQRIFSVARIDRFAFDVEVFHLAERYRLALTEVPVTLDDPGGSSVRVGPDSLRMLWDIVRIRRFAGQGAYDARDRPDALTV